MCSAVQVLSEVTLKSGGAATFKCETVFVPHVPLGSATAYKYVCRFKELKTTVVGPEKKIIKHAAAGRMLEKLMEIGVPVPAPYCTNFFVRNESVIEKFEDVSCQKSSCSDNFTPLDLTVSFTTEPDSEHYYTAKIQVGCYECYGMSSSVKKALRLAPTELWDDLSCWAKQFSRDSKRTRAENVNRLLKNHKDPRVRQMALQMYSSPEELSGVPKMSSRSTRNPVAQQPLPQPIVIEDSSDEDDVVEPTSTE